MNTKSFNSNKTKTMKQSIFKKIGLMAVLFMTISLFANAQGEKPSPAKTAEGEINGAKITCI